MEKRQFKKIHKCIDDAIGNTVGQDIVHIITSFAIGYRLKCCNKFCKNYIHIYNKTDFFNNIDCDQHEIYQYKISVNNANYENHREIKYLFGTYIRAFCSNCTANELEQCQGITTYYYHLQCGNKDIKYYEECKNHAICPECNRAMRNDGVKCCEFCNTYICNGCRNDMLYAMSWYIDQDPDAAEINHCMSWIADIYGFRGHRRYTFKSNICNYHHNVAPLKQNTELPLSAFNYSDNKWKRSRRYRRKYKYNRTSIIYRAKYKYNPKNSKINRNRKQKQREQRAKKQDNKEQIRHFMKYGYN